MRRADARRDDGAPSEEILRRIRIPLIRRATLHWPARTEEVFMVDIGLLGIFVERAIPLAVGEALEIRFCLPENDIPITARCRVAWWRAAGEREEMKALPSGAGLEFVGVSRVDQERIREYLSAYYQRNPNSRRFVRHGAWTDEREGKP
jgi:hypothetical protein